MIRRKEKRKNVKKQNWKKEKEPYYGYSEMSMRRNRRDYGMSSQRKPRERLHSEYSYNTSEDRYNGWQDIYRPDYRRDQYSTYDSLYDTDDDETYRYQSRRKYDDNYYDDTDYSSYYDEDDTDYTDKKSYSDRRLSKHSERRRGKMFDEPKYLYRYEEDRPGYRHNHSYNTKNKRNIPSETNQPRHGNDMDIYAIHNILGQKGFKYKKYDTIEPQQTSEIFSDTDIEPGYRGHVKRKRKPEYNIYSTQVTNNATVFDKKLKSPSPEKLVSVTDYQEIPMLAFKKKYKRGSSLTGESDFVYLPVVMKEKDKKVAQKRNIKTYPRFQDSTETAEKPLEDNIKVYRAMDSGKTNFFKYKKNRGSEQNLNLFKANRKGINVYTVSSGPSQVFRKSATNTKNMKKTKSNTSVKSDNFTEQIPDTGSSIVHTTNTGASNEMMNVEPTDSGGSIAVPIKTRSMEENRKSKAEPTETKKESTERSVTKSSIGALRDKSVARKSSAIGKTSSNKNDTFETDLEGQNTHKSVIRQSYNPPRDQSVVNERKSLATGQKIFATGLQSNLNDQKTPLKSIIKPSTAPQNRSVIKKSYVVDQQDLNNKSQYLGNNFSDLELEGQDLQRRSRQSIDAPKSVARQSNVLPRSQTSTENKKSLVTQQTVPKSLLRPNLKKSLVKQSSATQRGQSFMDTDQVTGVEEQNTQKSIARQSGVQRGQSVVARDQIVGSENQSTKKSLLSQSSAVRGGQSFVDRDQVIGTRGQSLVRQSNAAQRVQSFVDRDQGTGLEEQNTQKSMARQSGVQRGQSVVARDQIMGTENQSTKKSLLSQSSAVRGGQSFVDRDQVIGTQGQSLVRQSNAGQRVQSFVEKDQGTGIENQNTQKSMARKSTIPQRNQSIVDRGQIMETQRQSSATRRGQSFVDRDNTLGTEVQSPQKSLGRQSSAARRGESFVNRNQVTGIEEQNASKNMARQISVARRGQSFVEREKTLNTEGQRTQKSLARQSSAVQRGESLIDRNQVTGIKEQNAPKSMARQSNVAERGQSFLVGDQIVGIEGRKTQKSMGGKSSTAQRGEDFEVRDQVTERLSTQKSKARQNSVAQRGQNFEDGRKSSFVEQQRSDINLQEIEPQGAQPEISVLGPDAVSKRDQRKSSVVRQQTLTRNEQGNTEDFPRSNIKSGLYGSNLKQPQQSVGVKRPTKTKSKTMMKRAFTKLGTFSRRQGQREKDQDSNSTAPMLDVIMSEGNNAVKSQNPSTQSITQRPLSEASSGSIKQQAISTKPKKSTKSKLSKPFKSLLRRSKKSDLRQKQPSNIEDVQPQEQSDLEAIHKTFDEQNQHSSEQSIENYAEMDHSPASDEAYDQTDADISDEQLKPKKRTSSDESVDYPLDDIPPILKEYDLTSVLYFLQIAQFILGVTIYDKLMEVFAVL